MRIFTLSLNSKFRRITQALSLALGLVLMTVVANAQIDQNWTGATSNNFIVEDNWDPVGSPSENYIYIPMPDTSMATGSPDAQPFNVEVTGSEDITVKGLEIAFASDDAYQSTLTINLDEGYTFNVDQQKGFERFAQNGIDYNWTGIIVKSGTYKYTRTNYMRLDRPNCWFKVEGGIAEFNNIGMGDRNPGTGGKIYISGGEVICHEDFLRADPTREGGQIEITGDGKLTVPGNFEMPAEDWINGGAEYSIRKVYDAINNVSIFTAVPGTYVGIENADRQQQKTGETASDTLNLINTTAVEEASNFQWQYHAEGSDTYVNFTGEYSDSAKYAPVFTEAGTFFVSCLVDGVRTENEVEFSVVLDLVSFLPAEFDVQFLRVGQFGTEITAKFADAITSMEWKYATVPGGPYVSFEPAATDASFKPSFTENGNYYVVVDAQYNGASVISSELSYVVEDATKAVRWTGMISTDPTDPANWSPIAHYFKNNVTIPALDSVDMVAPNYPVFNMTSNDTINDFYLDSGAKAEIISGTDGIIDTFNFRANAYISGSLTVQDVFIDYTSLFWRLSASASEMTMKGSSTLSILYVGAYNASLSMSKGDGAWDEGGRIYMYDDSKIDLISFHRMNTEVSDTSVISINDQASIYFKGDARSAFKTYIDSTKFRCESADFEPYVLYPYMKDGQDYTVVQARDKTAFAIADDSRSFTTAGNEISTPITLTNIDGVTSFEWKYSTNPFGPWESFEPAATDPNFKPSFPASGDYYIVAITSDDVVTSNLKLVTVVDLKVSPSAYQQIDTSVETKGDTLKVDITLPGDLTILASEWFTYDLITGVDEPSNVKDSVYVPVLFIKGKYEIYYWTEVQDANGNSFELISNRVKFYVDVDVKADEIVEGNFELYPNPAKDAFYVNEESTSYSVSLIDAQGRVVLKKAFDNAYGAQRIDFNKSGMYIVKVKTNNFVKTKRIVIE